MNPFPVEFSRRMRKLGFWINAGSSHLPSMNEFRVSVMLTGTTSVSKMLWGCTHFRPGRMVKVMVLQALEEQLVRLLAATRREMAQTGGRYHGVVQR